jgi:hypothetical protein
VIETLWLVRCAADDEGSWSSVSAPSSACAAELWVRDLFAMFARRDLSLDQLDRLTGGGRRMAVATIDVAVTTNEDRAVVHRYSVRCELAFRAARAPWEE